MDPVFIPGKKRIISFLAPFFHRRSDIRGADLILVRGAPGVGKTMLSHLLVSAFPKAAAVELDSFKGIVSFPDGIDRARYRKIQESAWKACRSYLEDGYRPVIVVDTFSSEILWEFLAMVHQSPTTYSRVIITLVCDPGVLEMRLHGRQSSESCTRPSLAINEDMRTWRLFDELLVDTTARTPGEVLAVVLGKV
jgi:hypothetical protein